MDTTITPEDLEAIRAVAISYLQASNNENSQTFIPELRRGQVVCTKSEKRIGIWTLEKRTNEINLIRNPPISTTMYIFTLILHQQDKRWVVTREFIEIERLEEFD